MERAASRASRVVVHRSWSAHHRRQPLPPLRSRAGTRSVVSRRMSCSMTIDAVRDRRKTVTRRHVDTWRNINPDDLVTLIEKGMGLAKGEKQVVLAEVEIVDVRVEPISLLSHDVRYGRQEIGLEGFDAEEPHAAHERGCGVDPHSEDWSCRCDGRAHLGCCPACSGFSRLEAGCMIDHLEDLGWKLVKA